MNTIEVSEVSKSYGSRAALDHVSWTAGVGVSGLLGPNGAGKTTLLRILATASSADAGQVRVLGHDPTTAEGRLAIRRRLGYFPQEPGYYADFSVFSFVDHIAILKEQRPRRARHDEVRRVLALVGLEGEASTTIRKLSGGMRRRIIIAQAFIGDPDVIVLDEPTVGLDPEQRLRFREVIGAAGADRTVVLSTHQTEDVAALCARVAVMDQGRVLFDGSPIDLADRAAGRVWLADEPHPDARLCWRTATGRYRVIGAAPDRAEPVEPTIEDAYLLLVGERALTAAKPAA